MLKKALSLFLAVLLILSVIPTVLASAEDTDKMLNISVSSISSGSDELRVMTDVEIGKTYYYTFTLTKAMEGCFEVVCRNNNSGGSKNGVNGANITQVSRYNAGKAYTYTYSFTIPETDNSGVAITENIFFIIRFKSACAGYLLNASVYESTDENKTEILANGNFKSNMSGWYLESTSLSSVGAEYLDNAYVTLKVEDLDTSLLEFYPSKMLHISKTDTTSHELSQLVNVTAGQTYYFTFSLSNTITSFEIVSRNNRYGTPGVNASITQVSVNKKGSSNIYTYSFTVPETDNNGNAITDGIFFIFRTNAICDGYFFDAHVYNSADADKNELLENTNFGTGLDNWGLRDISFEGDTYTTDGLTLTVVDYDYSLVGMGLPTKMMHINKTVNTANCELKTSVAVELGETYQFTFALSDTITTEHFEVVARVNNGSWSQPGVSSGTISQVSKLSKGKVNIYTYNIPISASDTNIGENEVYFIIRLKNAAVCEGYLFGLSAYNVADENKYELLDDPDFSLGLDSWVAGFNEFGEGDTEGVDRNNTTTLKILDFDESLLENGEPEKMLHINKTGTSKYFELKAPVDVNVGDTYYYTFALTNTISESDFEMVFRVVADSWSGQVGIPAVTERVSVQNKGNANVYTYAVTIPETDNGGNDISDKDIHFIIRIKQDVVCEGYFFGAEIYNTNDIYKCNIITNPDFSEGLKGWGATYNFFNTEVTEGSDTYDTTALKVVDFNLDIYKTMLYIRNESVDMVGEPLLQKISGLEADKEYTVSFNYYFASGKLNEALDFVIIDSPNDKEASTRLIQSGVESEYVDYTTVDNGINVKYTFTYDSTLAETYQNLYAGFYFESSARYITEMYVSDFVIYATEDEAKTNLFAKTSFFDMYGWRSNWTEAESGAESFGTLQNEALDYTARYVAYDEDLFTAEKDVIHYGDGNFDGNIDIIDFIVAKKNIVNKGNYFSSLDCNNDGTVTAEDLPTLVKHLLDVEAIEWEASKSSLQAAASLIGGADQTASELKEEIANTQDTVIATATAKVYYVAEDGNDSNDGLSEDKAITVNKLNSITYSSGDVVLFKRGDLFRVGEIIKPQSNVSYGAYGSGAKPMLSGSLKDYADKALWTTEDGYLWQTPIAAESVGNIVFNGGEYVGVPQLSLEKANDDGEFYFDEQTGTLYLYLRQINPASRFSSIEIASTNRFMNGANTVNMTVENLAFEYFGEHTFNLMDCSGIKITGCEFNWIGGKFTVDSETGLKTESRLGNAIQFWDSAADCNVSYNRFYQIYDAAVTFQGNDGDVYNNLTYTKNLVEYSSMNFEFWDSDNVTMTNIDFTDNILRFAGYGFGYQRSKKGNQAFVLTWNNAYETGTVSNFNITGNTFDVANCCFYYAANAVDKLNISGNTYYQNSNSFYSVNKGTIVYAKDLASFETAIKAVDANAVVNWLE